MTEKLTCGRLSTCELCSRCLLHLPLRRTTLKPTFTFKRTVYDA